MRLVLAIALSCAITPTAVQASTPITVQRTVLASQLSAKEYFDRAIEKQQKGDLQGD